jgi:hypothetical protein
LSLFVTIYFERSEIDHFFPKITTLSDLTKMDESIDNFVAFTGSSQDVARRYLGLTENNLEQAIQLFFDSPDLGGDQGAQTPAPPLPTSTRPSRQISGHEGEESRHPVELSDDDDMEIDNGNEDHEASRAAAVGRAADYEDDEAIARRMQEELYAGGDGGTGYGGDGVRAPIGRTTETLVGGHDGGWQPDGMQEEVMRQFRSRPRPGGSSCMYL